MKRFTVILSITVSVAFAGLLGYIYWLEYGLWSIAVCAAMLLGLPFCSFMHEAGHMLFGAVCKLKARPHFSVFGSSSCKIVPKTDKNLRRRLCFTVCGGLIVNLLFCIVGIVALDVKGCPVWLSLFIPASVYLLIMNAMPVKFSSGNTDGLTVLELLQLSPEAEVLLSVLTVQAQVLNGKPIEEIEEKLLFGVPQIAEDEEAFIALTELRYEYFKAKGEIEKSEAYRSRFEELKKEYL